MVEDLRDQIIRKAELTNKILAWPVEIFQGELNYQSSVDRLILMTFEATSSHRCC